MPATTLTQQDEINLIRAGGAGLAGTAFEHPITLQNAVFPDKLDLSQCRFARGVDFSGCRFAGGLTLADAVIEGPLTFSVGETQGAPDTPCRVEGDLDLTSAAIAGNVYLTGVFIGGTLWLEAADIGGNLACFASETQPGRIEKDAQMFGARVKGSLVLGGLQVGGALTLDTAKIGGAADFGRCGIAGNISLNGAVIGDSLNFTGANLQQSLFLENASVGGTLFCVATQGLTPNIPCQIQGTAWLMGLTTTGNLSLNGAQIGGDLVMQSARVGQNLTADLRGGLPSRIGGQAHLNVVRVAGVASFAGAQLEGDLNLSGAAIDGGLTFLPGLDDAAGWQLRRPRINGRIDAEMATIGKQVLLLGLDAGPVSFTGAQINGRFALWSDEQAAIAVRYKKAEIPPPGSPPPAITDKQEEEVLKEYARETTRIQGALRLNQTQVAGDITLNGVQITGDLDLSNVTAGANFQCLPVSGQRPARAAQADLSALEAAGDVDLTGLTTAGRLRLRDAHIRGSLKLYPRSPDDAPTPGNAPPETEEHTRIGDDLDLEALEAAHVILSGHSFSLPADAPDARSGWKRWQAGLKEDWTLRQPAQEPDPPVKIKFERARIARLAIVDPLPRVDLSDMTVGSWEEPHVAPPGADFLRNTLRRSYPFRRSNYLAIITDLRNKGRDEDADEILIDMRRRDRRSTRAVFSRLADMFFDATVLYGTTSARLVYPMLVMFAFSVWFFHNPRHVEYKISPSAPPPHATPAQKRQAVEAQVHPDADDWKWSDAVFLATRLHVPILSLGLSEDVAPSGVGPEVYAAAVQTLSWILWPLFLASASGFLRKRT